MESKLTPPASQDIAEWLLKAAELVGELDGFHADIKVEVYLSLPKGHQLLLASLKNERKTK